MKDATPRPWKVAKHKGRLEILPDTGEWNAAIGHIYRAGVVNTNRYMMPAEANAELIVRAVNAYEALVEACKLALLEFDHVADEPSYQGYLLCEKAKAALNQALAKAKE